MVSRENAQGVGSSFTSLVCRYIALSNRASLILDAGAFYGPPRRQRSLVVGVRGAGRLRTGSSSS